MKTWRPPSIVAARWLLVAGLAASLVACAQAPSDHGLQTLDRDPAWPSAQLLLLGEQHDAAEHQRVSAQVVTRLAAQRRLAALALEMADRGRSTAGLPTDASEAQVREALAWDDRGWPWAAYGPIAMAAVRAGVPVVGANLPRSDTRNAMRDAALDARVPDEVRARLAVDVREGHCQLLPESQLPGMTRVQIARDASMAETLQSLAQPGRVVVLVAGQNHVDASRGVPQHLRRQAPSLTLRTVMLAAGGAGAEGRVSGYDEAWATPPVPPVDHCAGLAEKLGPAR